MASKIRYYLEQSVPELDDLKKKGLFDQKEITMIMRRRTDFEHRIQGRGCKPRDFLKYSDFEINLEKLRAKRYSRLKKAGTLDTKPSISDWAGFRRIIFVFDRAVKRFPGDIGLWAKYIQFVKEKDAVKVVYRVYAKLLLLQPRNVEAWLSAAKYEFEVNANAKGARELYQRALKLNPELQKLWMSYIQFELTYVSKLLARRKVLGLLTEKQQQDDLQAQEKKLEKRKAKTINGIEDNDDMISLEDDPEQMKAQLEQLPEADMNVLGNPDTNPVLRGEVALAVFDMCVPELLKEVAKTMRQDKIFELVEDFFAVVDKFENLSRDHLYLHGLLYLQEHCDDRTRVALVDVKMPLRNVLVTDPDFAEALQLSVNKFNAYKKKLSENREKFTAPYIAFLNQYVETAPENVAGLLKAIIQKCQ